MAQPKRIRLGDLLVEHKLISETQLTGALTEQKKSGHKLGRVLIENGYVKEDDVLDLLSRQLNVPFVDISTYEFKPEVVKILPETAARRYRALALEETPEGLLVGMTDPTNIFAYDDLVRVVKREIRIAVVKEGDLVAAMDRVYQHGAEIQNLATEIGEDMVENVFDLGALNQGISSSDAPVVKLIETVFEDAVAAKASDIHIEPDEKVLRIRRRIDGVLQEQVMDEKAIAPAVVSRLKLMAGLDISERRLPQDGRFNLKLKTKSVDVRFSTMPTQYGEAVVMRLLDHSEGVLSLDQIGLVPVLKERLKKAIHRPHGLLLVTGPTGSGKTTTLYSALNDLNDPTKKIITVEDPVEYRLPRINQVQVNPKIGLDFARVLRSTLRQDPDIILVGEIRDQETAEIALRASITGHLVLSTLHTNDAISTALRLIDMGVEGFLVASAVHAIVAQRLVRRICEKCSTDYTLDAGQQAWLSETVSEERATNMRFKQGAGCQACGKSGYKGRAPVHEMLDITGELADALRNQDYAAFKERALAQKQFIPLVDSALALAEQGTTSIDEVIRISGWIE
ncbi:MAG: Flp pilus assembly complex ATPase component [Gammaproteobacteria bacterium]|nr:Flp pilus assembly complex ATPase component [Gammaproteobacteria bacterium]